MLRAQYTLILVSLSRSQSKEVHLTSEESDTPTERHKADHHITVNLPTANFTVK